MEITRREYNEFTKRYDELKCLLLEIKEGISFLKSEKQKELLTPKEVQALIGIGKTTYQRYVKAQVLNQIKIGGKAFVQRSEIENLIDEGKL